MTYKISNDQKTLTICVDEAERQELREIEAIGADTTMHDFLEPIICNSELEWISPADTGDLTDAPMLGICGEVMTIDKVAQAARGFPGIYGSVLCGHWKGKDRHRPILERWAFLDYQVRSVLEDLRDKGEAVFIS